MSAPSLSPAAAFQTSRVVLVGADVQPVDHGHAAGELAVAFDRDPVARPRKADRAVERHRHRGRVGEREADLAGLDVIGLAGAAVRFDGEFRFRRADRLDRRDLVVLEHGGAARDVPADHFDWSFERKTARAASGSTQMLYSAAGVTLPSQQGAPPITTQRPIRSASSGSRSSASAILVSGPSVTRVRPGSALREAQDRVDRAARARPCASAQGSRDRQGRPCRGTSARAHARGRAACPRRRRRERRTCRSRRSGARCGSPASTPTLPATVVSPRTLTLGSASAMMIATASSEAVSVSMRKLRMGSGIANCFGHGVGVWRACPRGKA